MILEQVVKRVVIAGGGTAGWVVAAALGKHLGRLVEVTLVESEEIGTVGVGESTIPTVRSFHALLGIDEREFLRATSSTFKLGISFENWAEIGDRYFHAFGVVGRAIWMGDFHHFWFRGREQGFAGDIGDYCFELQAALAEKFATSEKGGINYAYHLDAGLYARFLRSFAEANGIKRVEGKIARVEQNGETGFIEALELESHERIEGDLFIDCTGFRGLLIEGALQAGYEDWTHWLPTNSALPLQTRAVGPALPYTRAIAHRAGWQWRIPLQHRVGNGLVYCSDFMSDDEAHDLLHSSVEGEVIVAPRPIRYRAGMRRKAWVKNCVAFGLSSGFVEPLESTSIHLFMIGVTRLIQLFPFAGITDSLAERYNELSRAELERVRDFIILHYKATERDDSDFWRQCREMSIPDTLAARIELFRENGIAYQAQDDLFRVDSWVQVLLGQRVTPKRYHAMGELLGDAQLEEALADLKGNIARAVAGMPTHQAFVEGYVT
ncbi:tryptophan halogenase family protein [Sphingomonas sp.]|uniref:tryptophan halogenase family protein n=1 Tax=Sphingomonas sp. TaxID=28214 RepID=UPI001B02AA89|nr:tryptophan halogenase family protein [Sphingomonas sp.]MBO9713740.1 tryptophan 7-halogenase [Sphingomonas sp.]